MAAQMHVLASLPRVMPRIVSGTSNTKFSIQMKDDYIIGTISVFAQGEKNVRVTLGTKKSATCIIPEGKVRELTRNK